MASHTESLMLMLVALRAHPLMLILVALQAHGHTLMLILVAVQAHPLVLILVAVQAHTLMLIHALVALPVGPWPHTDAHIGGPTGSLTDVGQYRWLCKRTH
jgi:hypothetical protein